MTSINWTVNEAHCRTLQVVWLPYQSRWRSDLEKRKEPFTGGSSSNPGTFSRQQETFTAPRGHCPPSTASGFNKSRQTSHTQQERVYKCCTTWDFSSPRKPFMLRYAEFLEVTFGFGSHCFLQFSIIPTKQTTAECSPLKEYRFCVAGPKQRVSSSLLRFVLSLHSFLEVHKRRNSLGARNLFLGNGHAT